MSFTVSEEDAAAIRAVYEEEGELSATIELRRRFPGLANNENTRICARSIASWSPAPLVKPPPPVRRRSRKP